MKLFYTVISQPNVIQTNPSLSLGGFKSSSVVPNSSFENLFPDISSYTIQQDLTSYIGLILENTFQTPTSSIELWIPKIENSAANFKLAITDIQSNGEIENVPTVNSKPVYAQFYETSTENRIKIEKVLQPKGQIGVWIERSLNLEELKKYQNCDYLYENLDKEVQTTEVQTINIEFNIQTVIYLSTTSPIYRLGERIQVYVREVPKIIEGQPLTWSSLNESIATVDQSGVVQAVGIGIAQIQVMTPGNIGGICTFEIVL